MGELGGTSNLKANPLRNRCPGEEAQPTLGSWTGFQPVRLETPSDPKARMVPLYHGGSYFLPPI
ncbi:hypothetical protein E2C01_050112 [Portunus trituberculatus]|uniref:Uncharacterized protein n=1 Tax=Portunus trituberculatus TaxID=210409 RepID=A0A5B7GF73_PORTR|nr:hypothetical protein [Portunus trituberculatus]